jgi:hypothetical protein
MVAAINGKPNVGKRGPDKKPRKKRGVLESLLVTYKNLLLNGIVKGLLANK